MTDSKAGRKLVGGGEVPRMTRAFAALSLGLIGSGPMAPKLRLVIEKEDPRTRKDLIACAFIALGFMDCENVRDDNVRFLIRMLDNPRLDPALKANVPTALGRLGDPAAVPAIVKKFNDRKTHFSVRQSCAIALGYLAVIEQGDVIALLRRCIDRDGDALTRHLCFIALAQIGARDGDPEANASLHREIASLFLKEVARPDRQQYRAWAALAGAIHAREHEAYKAPLAGRIREAFHETSNPSDRSALAVSLGLLRDTGSAEMLEAELEDTKNKALQGYICVGLGLMNRKQSSAAIREIVENETVFTLRLQAARALGMMGDTEAVAVLVDVLKNSSTLTVTASAAKALGLIGDSRAVDPLQAVLADTKAGGLSRAFAAVALGILGEKTDLPWNAAISAHCNYAAMGPAVSEVLDIF
jgi:HEAT repeat protein